WFVYAAFLASMGLWISLVSRTTFRATIWVLVVVLGMSIGPWLVGFVWGLLFPPMSGAWRGLPKRDEATVVLEYGKLALSPPYTPASLAFTHRDWEPEGYASPASFYEREPRPVEMMPGLIASGMGLLGYGLAAWLFWGLLRSRFAGLTGRMPLPGMWQAAALKPPGRGP